MFLNEKVDFKFGNLDEKFSWVKVRLLLLFEVMIEDNLVINEDISFCLFIVSCLRVLLLLKDCNFLRNLDGGISDVMLSLLLLVRKCDLVEIKELLNFVVLSVL